jgi:chemotaxis protein methyltransferase CheR
MPHERHARALGNALAPFGLDLNRYTAAHAQNFLSHWPDQATWPSSEAQSSLLCNFAIGETSFMRHPEHFAAVRALLPALHQQRAGSPLRVWSAGCASGEEAYSLAATLLAAGRSSFELFAWDLNPEAIARAMRGEYRPWSLRGVNVLATQDWLAPAPCGVRVESWLQKLVQFAVGNLHADVYPESLDVVFCRNVLLYFRRDAAAQVLARIARSLNPGGALILGHYDPAPSSDTGLVPEFIDGTLIYRKQSDGRALANERARGSVRPERLLPHSAKALAAAQSLSAATHMELVRLLVNQRRTEHALHELSTLRARSPLRADLHVLTALAAEESGDMRLMLEAARNACFLLPEQPGPNYFLSVAFVRNGELRRAAVHRRIAAAALRQAGEGTAVVEYSEGLTVGQLRRLVGAGAR